MTKVDVIREVAFANAPEGQVVVTQSKVTEEGVAEMLKFDLKDLKGDKGKVIEAKVVEMGIRASFGISPANTAVADASFIYDLNLTLVNTCKCRLEMSPRERQKIVNETARMMLRLRQIAEQLNIDCSL